MYLILILKKHKKRKFEFNPPQSTAIFGSQSVPDRNPKRLDRDQKFMIAIRPFRISIGDRIAIAHPSYMRYQALRALPSVTCVTERYMRYRTLQALPSVTDRYRPLQNVTERYRPLQNVTSVTDRYIFYLTKNFK